MFRLDSHDKWIAAGLLAGIVACILTAFIILSIRFGVHSPRTSPRTSRVVTPTTLLVQDITVTNKLFIPGSMTVVRGAHINWINFSDSALPIVLDSVTHASEGVVGTLALNESKIVTYSTPGTYSYHVEGNPSQKGMIIVQ